MSLIGAVVKALYANEINADQAQPKKRGRGGIREIKKAFGKFLEKHNSLVWTFRIIAAAVVATLAWGLIHSYNDYARYNTRATAYFAHVGVELKRRNNLIPNLIMAAKRYAVHEGEVFRHVCDARELFTNAKSATDKIRTAGELDMALSRLLAIFEQYPDLKATQSMQDLIKELSNTEDRIATEKMKYNEVARAFNQLRQTFPTNILGVIYGFNKNIPYIGSEEDILKAPEVQLEWKEDSRNEDG